MVKIMIEITQKTDKKLKHYMVDNDISNKDVAINKILNEKLLKK